MNVYLARLKAQNLKTCHPDQPSKPSELGFEGYEGDPGLGVLKNQGLVCLVCSSGVGLPGSREITVRSTVDGRLALCHQDCLNVWLWGHR